VPGAAALGRGCSSGVVGGGGGGARAKSEKEVAINYGYFLHFT
jgi:hypothetical protein